MKSLSAFLVAVIATLAFTGCKPTPEFPDPLDAETARQIKQDYLDQFNTTGEMLSLENVTIEFYYGTYNGNAVLLFTPFVSCWIITYETVAGLTFSYSAIEHVILVYKNGEFITLTQAYENGDLTLRNLRNIHALHNIN